MFKYSLVETVDVVDVHKTHVTMDVKKTMMMTMMRIFLLSLFLDPQDNKDQQDLKERMDHKDPKDHGDPQVIQEPMM